MLEVISLVIGIALGIVAAIIPYQKNVSNEERLRWGARKP
jgi:hypothetical protein